MNIHYTAVIEIHQVADDEGTGRGDGKRFTREVARVVVRAGTIDALKAKVAGHVALVDEDDAR